MLVAAGWRLNPVCRLPALYTPARGRGLYCFVRGWYRPRTSVFLPCLGLVQTPDKCFFIFLLCPGLVQTPDKCIFHFFALSGVGTDPGQVLF
jgi:hypothetical protein